MDLPRILAVDDDPAILEWLDAILGEEKALVVSSTVKGAVRLLETHDAFDLLILDVHLPDGQGTEILREVRTRPAFECLRETPVIMLTGTRDSEAYEDSWDLGMIAWVTKPFSIEALSTAIDGALAGRKP